MNRYFYLFALMFCWWGRPCQSQGVEEVGESLKQYIKTHHVEKIEDMVHHLSSSRSFFEQFVGDERRELMSHDNIRKRDVKIGDDIDIYVKHFTEHQNFTMIMVPISIYSANVYDTLLFSVLEVTDSWLKREFPYDDMTNDSIKSDLMSKKNHDIFAQHLYDQALEGVNLDMGRFKVIINESYLTSNSVHTNMSHMTDEEKKMIRHNWGLLKKAFSHDVVLNLELNMYVFGYNDMEVIVQSKRKLSHYKVTPSNIFKRHHFQED